MGKKVYLIRGSFMEESEAVVNTFQDMAGRLTRPARGDKHRYEFMFGCV